MTHANAPLTPEGRRRLAVLVVEQGWPLRRAAERFQVSPTTARRWASRYRAGQPMTDHPSRPAHSPDRLARRTERRIIALRHTRRWGPHRIAYHLGLHRSTVGRVLARYHVPRLADTDQATGLPLRRPRPQRYERTAPGQLVHVDIKKLGRIPDGGGWRAHGRGSAQDRAASRTRDRAARKGASPSRGWRWLHHAVDDYSRAVYSEILDDETKDTAAGFWRRANAFFVSLGTTIQEVMTDNGACYRSQAFNQALQATGAEHRHTRPYRPQTNGKVERFNRTLQQEWAYARDYASEADRAAAYHDRLHYYNHHRPHTSTGGQTPAQRVHNLTGKYT
ncbi:IS481 family transposase [Actinomyces wuliandei]|uniref:IS481 family transposase n=1 Tax=Actinomyces wuliandei TaxID=2057743 RepID=UPI001118776A|nr:IS481 family transposase [Actinomyces wuliandei]